MFKPQITLLITALANSSVLAAPPVLPSPRKTVPRRRPLFAPGIDGLEARVHLNGASGGVQIGVDQTTANLLYQDFMNNSQVPSGNTGNVAAGIAGGLARSILRPSRK